MASFNEWLTDQGLASVDDGTSQNYFSKYYTQWLDSEVVGNEEVASFLSQQLEGDMLLAFESGAFKVVMNQNSTDGAPYLDFGDELGLFSLDSIFTGDKDDFTWTQGKAEQTRYFYDSFALPMMENQAPTDIRLVINSDFADSLAGNVTSTGDSKVIATLEVTDADPEDTHIFEIDGSSDTFEIVDGNQLKLIDGEEIDTSSGQLNVTIKVTDSAGNEYYETFNFVAGTDPFIPGSTNPNRTDELDGIDNDGTGTQEDPVVGDDTLFGFRGDDILSGGSGDDILIGSLNNDLLIGGAGNDQLHGGNGADTFLWQSGDEGTSDAPAVDYVMDFNADADTININDLLGAEGTYLFGESDGSATLEISSNGSDVDQVIVFNGFTQEALEAVLVQGDNLIT